MSNAAFPGRPRICLSMIVKNEADVIRRCLDSVKPWIDAWIIVDTGSTDGTPDIIEEHMKDLPGKLVHRPWVNFGHNRTESLELAKKEGDYVFTIDADEVLVTDAGFSWGSLGADLYYLKIHHGSLEYDRDCLVASRKTSRWEGWLHEYLHVEDLASSDPIHGAFVLSGFDGARNRNPRKYEDDAKLLEAAVAAEPDNRRSWFCLAQSYRDANLLEQALMTYERRAEMGGWDEEIWYSLYECARLAERLGRPYAEVVARYLKAYQARPSRAEPLVYLARFFHGRGEWHLALMAITTAMAIPFPTDRLLIDRPCYGWLRKDEYGLALDRTGRSAQAKLVWESLLSVADLPEHERMRVESNIAWVIQHRDLSPSLNQYACGVLA